MKSLIKIFLLVTFLSPQLSKVWMIVDFKVNQESIANKHCINKAKPTSKCNGKCYLSKQLKNAEEKTEKELPNQLREKTETTLYISKVKNTQTERVLNKLLKPHFYEVINLYASSYINEIFRPPEFIII